MATLQQQIVEKFLTKLAESKDVDAGKIEQLKKLLAGREARRSARRAAHQVRACDQPQDR
jgi:hypothetical protein